MALRNGMQVKPTEMPVVLQKVLTGSHSGHRLMRIHRGRWDATGDSPIWAKSRRHQRIRMSAVTGAHLSGDSGWCSRRAAACYVEFEAFESSVPA